MTVLTVFSAPKPFTNPHIATIQRNAIRSWLELPDTEVILIGEEDGLAETAKEFGVKHLPNVARNPEGTPLVSSIFALARDASDSPALAYVNADIILLPDFVTATRKMLELQKEFLVVGQRWDLDVTTPLDFSNDWASKLEAFTRQNGKLHRPMGSDYFIYPRQCFVDMPAFAIGRAGWDNWMIYKALKERWLTVDATESIFIIHQNHDYSHLPGGQPHYKLPETYENIRLAGGRAVTRLTLLNISKRLTAGGIRPQVITAERLWQRIESFPLLRLGTPKFTNALWRLRQLFTRKQVKE